MSEIMALGVALLGGALLGAFFFGGLWWTVQKGMQSENPALWFIGSLMLRTAVVLWGFFLVSQGHWSRIASCLVGFVIARVIVVRWFAREHAQPLAPLEKETNVAP